MQHGGSWIVEIHHDNINTRMGFMLVFEELLGMSAGEGAQLVDTLDQNGHADFTPLPQPEAERLVAAFQVRGVSAKLRKARRA
ncbi:hypothetical protein BS329_18710 [Amycolatopsis coloradensis]|uniref:Uncharacterized protein n=1 Tax=Amycolatopsis coloradensis TaxID=76021 RepID=A0A1R0KRQ0_9PSEU|nr:hypothetical protein [Amycolatopsis coloradensis]OLZ50472.1 hypothetical protein BS329_18710 [Amycolatopsis coloradensis]